MRVFVSLFLALLITIEGRAITSKTIFEHENYATVVTVQIISEHKVKWTVQARNEGYLGIGFPSIRGEMTNSDAVVGVIRNGNSLVYDSHIGTEKAFFCPSSGSQVHGLCDDETLGGKYDLIDASISFVDHITTLTFTRLRDTGDIYDQKYAEPGETQNLLIALGMSNTFAYHGQRIGFSIQMPLYEDDSNTTDISNTLTTLATPFFPKQQPPPGHVIEKIVLWKRTKFQTEISATAISEDEVKWDILTKNNGWVAIGFPSRPEMTMSDVVLGVKGIVTDAHIGPEKRLGCPKDGIRGLCPDISVGGTNDLKNSKISVVNGVTHMTFTRKVSTSDEWDISFSKPGQKQWLLIALGPNDNLVYHRDLRDIISITMPVFGVGVGVEPKKQSSPKQDFGDHLPHQNSTPAKKCFVGGCEGEVCSESPNTMSICSVTCHKSCYKYALCQKKDGVCGWDTSSSAYSECVASCDTANTKSSSCRSKQKCNCLGSNECGWCETSSKLVNGETRSWGICMNSDLKSKCSSTFSSGGYNGDWVTSNTCNEKEVSISEELKEIVDSINSGVEEYELQMEIDSALEKASDIKNEIEIVVKTILPVTNNQNQVTVSSLVNLISENSLSSDKLGRICDVIVQGFSNGLGIKSKRFGSCTLTEISGITNKKRQTGTTKTYLSEIFFGDSSASSGETNSEKISEPSSTGVSAFTVLIVLISVALFITTLVVIFIGMKR